MTMPVKRRQDANKKKMQEAAKAVKHPNQPDGPDLRQSPAGRKLAALRKKKGTE